MSCREINSEKLALLESKTRLAEGYASAMDKAYNFDFLSYAGYNAKRGTTLLKASGGGKAERRDMLPRVGKRIGEPILDTKPSKGMTGYHL